MPPNMKYADYIERLIGLVRQNEARRASQQSALSGVESGTGMASELPAAPPQQSRLDQTMEKAQQYNDIAQLAAMTGDMSRGPMLAAPTGVPGPQMGPQFTPSALQFLRSQSAQQPDIQQLIAMLSRR